MKGREGARERREAAVLHSQDVACNSVAIEFALPSITSVRKGLYE
jgi:hypothetical protein